MSNLRIAFLMLFCLSFFGSEAQHESGRAGDRVAVFVEFIATKQIQDIPLTSSRVRPGAGVGATYDLRTGQRTQVRLGTGLYGYSMVTRDYTVMYPDDWDPVRGEVDIYKSFVENETHFLQLVIPLHLKIWLGKASGRWYMAPGIEGRINLDEVITATVHESGVQVNELPHESLFRVRRGGVAASLEWGRSMSWQGHTLSLGVLGRYSLTRPFEVHEGGLFANTAKGRPVDLGVRVGFEL